MSGLPDYHFASMCAVSYVFGQLGLSRGPFPFGHEGFSNQIG
jgi:hypothetical protein